MALRCIADETLQNTGFHYTLSLIGGKYKSTILYALMEFQVVRFNELKRDLEGISQKVLTDSLRSMEEAGIITRTVYPEVPSRVEYALSEVGESMRPIIVAMEAWAPSIGKRQRNIRRWAENVRGALQKEAASLTFSFGLLGRPLTLPGGTLR